MPLPRLFWDKLINSNPMDLTSRRMLVTGASSGIGRETAILLAELGAEVIVSGRDEERLRITLKQLRGEGHFASAYDMAALDGIQGWIKNLAARHGPFDGVAHCAGIHAAAPLRVLSPAGLDEMMRINVYSAAMIAKGFRQKACRGAEGSIVLVSSVAGIVGEAGVPAYSASKAALIGMTRSLAMELAAEKIRVNAVVPGFVESEMSERLRQSLTAEQFEVIAKNHPLGIGNVRDVANGIAFLLGAAARWITGTSLIIDGGYTAH